MNDPTWLSDEELVSAYAESVIDRHVEHRHGWVVDLDRERMLKTKLMRRLATTKRPTDDGVMIAWDDVDAHAEALEYVWAMEEDLDNEVTIDDVGRARRNLRAALNVEVKEVE